MGGQDRWPKAGSCLWKALCTGGGCVGDQPPDPTTRSSLFVRSGPLSPACVGLKMRDGFVGGLEWPVYAPLLDVFQSFHDATVNDPALCGCVFVVSARQFGKDRDCPTRHLEFELVASFKTRPPPNGWGHHKRRFVFDGDGHGK